MFEAVEFPRGNLVVSMPSRDIVCALPTMAEAVAYAAAMNRWANTPPAPGDDPMDWGADWTERLLAILDKPYEAELQAAA